MIVKYIKVMHKKSVREHQYTELLTKFSLGQTQLNTKSFTGNNTYLNYNLTNPNDFY